jgi:hypothetical protein
MIDNRFNSVVILDSIPTGDSNTAWRLYEDIEICAVAYAPTPGLSYFKIENRWSFFNCLEQLRLQNEKRGVFPLLHIECHGDEDGLQFADGSLISWESLKEALIPLNVAMRLNLMIVLVSCFGGAFIKALRLSDRAPVWGLIGPSQKISSGEVEPHFGIFYRTLFSTGSPRATVDALNQSISRHNLYIRTTAEGFFYRVWRKYKEGQCTPQKLKARARRMRERAKELKIMPLEKVSEYKKKLVRDESKAFNKFRDTYFMYDLYPENQQRFSVTYKKAEAFDSQ